MVRANTPYAYLVFFLAFGFIFYWIYTSWITYGAVPMLFGSSTAGVFLIEASYTYSYSCSDASSSLCCSSILVSSAAASASASAADYPSSLASASASKSNFSFLFSIILLWCSYNTLMIYSSF